MTGSVEIEDYEDRDELSDDTSAMQSTASSAAISVDGNGNERKIEEEPPLPPPSKTDKVPKKRRRARPSIDITESVHGIKYDESENGESEISDLSDNVERKKRERKVTIEGGTKGQEVCWDDWELFDYADVSADTSKADEAVELMGNLLKDMDKALEAMPNL